MQHCWVTTTTRRLSYCDPSFETTDETGFSIRRGKKKVHKWWCCAKWGTISKMDYFCCWLWNLLIDFRIRNFFFDFWLDWKMSLSSLYMNTMLNKFVHSVDKSAENSYFRHLHRIQFGWDILWQKYLRRVICSAISWKFSQTSTLTMRLSTKHMLFTVKSWLLITNESCCMFLNKLSVEIVW